MLWDELAEKQLARTPSFVRRMARSRVEQMVRDEGRDQVTLEDFQSAYERFRRVFGGKSEASTRAAIPSGKAEHPQMVVVETCSGEVRSCPHLLLPVSEWADELESALTGIRFSERLLAKVPGETVLFHHKFKVSISGCPNCCSQPQIKDFGVHGQWEPRYNDWCTQCGRCMEACPDGCIEVRQEPEIDRSACMNCGDCVKACPVDDCLVAARQGARVMIGGKLGRHPHLAEPVLEWASLEDARDALLKMAEAFVETGLPDERLSDWIRRTGFALAG